MPMGLILTSVDVNMATKCAHTHTHAHTRNENVLHPFLDGNLTWGLYILRTGIPRCQSQCLFPCFGAEAGSLGNTQSLACRSVTMRCFHSVYLPTSTSHSCLLISLILSTVSSCLVVRKQHRLFFSRFAKSWNHAGLTLFLFNNFRTNIPYWNYMQQQH